MVPFDFRVPSRRSGSAAVNGTEGQVFSYGVPGDELFQCLEGRDFERRLFALLVGYIDESGSAETRLFTLSCIVSSGGMWWWFENSWIRVLEAKNAELRKAGRKELSRYKSADCNNYVNEFEGWTPDEQREFLQSLLKVFSRHNTAIFSYTINLRHIAEELPETKGKEQAVAYVLLLHNLMNIVGQRILSDKRFCDEKIALVHDRTSRYDGILTDAFNAMKNDELFIYGPLYATIKPMGWEDCIPLQPADLIAYENFKIAERKLAGEKRRKIMDLLLDLDSIGGSGRELTRDWVKEIKEKQTSEERLSLYEIAHILKPKCQA